MIASGKATLRDLDEYYSAEDMYDILEIIIVEAHNQNIVLRREKDKGY